MPRDGEKECVRRSALRLRKPGGRRNTRAGVLSFEPGEAFLRIGLRSGSGRRVPAGLADGKSNAVGMRPRHSRADGPASRFNRAGESFSATREGPNPACGREPRRSKTENLGGKTSSHRAYARQMKIIYEKR